MKRILTLCICLICCGCGLFCTSFEGYVRGGGLVAKPVNIGIGFIEKRDLELAPFVERNMQDSIKFELLKERYLASIVPIATYQIKNENIQKIIQENTLDIYIQGSIVQSTIGDAFSSDSHALITLSFHDKDGLFGEYKYYFSDDIANINNIRDASRKIVREFCSDISSKVPKKK